MANPPIKFHRKAAMTDTDNRFVFVREPSSSTSPFRIPEHPRAVQATALLNANIWQIPAEDADSLAAAYLAAGWKKATIHPTREHAFFEAASELGFDEFYSASAELGRTPQLVTAADLRAGDEFCDRTQTVFRGTIREGHFKTRTVTKITAPSKGKVGVSYAGGSRRMAADDVVSVVNR